MPPELDNTLVYTDADDGALRVRRWLVRIVGGPDVGQRVELERGSLMIGCSSSNDIVLTDPRVSRAHLELRLLEGGLLVRDLGSSNGTFQGETRIRESVLSSASVLRLGDTELGLDPADAEVRVDTDQNRLGEMIGGGAAMRQLFGVVRRIAPTDVSVLVEGETGTGKELIAHEIHNRSPRCAQPLVVVDCGALPAGLVESELFGHLRGAFTGAVSTRDGAFIQANGGTIFLDEVGELPLELQPKLLRVLEQRQLKRVGDNAVQTVDVRVCAATSRDLSESVAKGKFRPDLYYRLAVVRLRVPALRDRMEDIPLLVQILASRIAQRDIVVPEAVFNRLERHSWPGNVRELRNVLSHSLALRPESGILELPAVLGIEDASGEGSPAFEPTSGGDRAGDYREAKRKAVDMFEVRYLSGLLSRHGWNVSGAAREAGVDRNYLHRLMKRHKIRRP